MLSAARARRPPHGREHWSQLTENLCSRMADSERSSGDFARERPAGQGLGVRNPKSRLMRSTVSAAAGSLQLNAKPRPRPRSVSGGGVWRSIPSTDAAAAKMERGKWQGRGSRRGLVAEASGVGIARQGVTSRRSAMRTQGGDVKWVNKNGNAWAGHSTSSPDVLWLAAAHLDASAEPQRDEVVRAELSRRRAELAASRPNSAGGVNDQSKRRPGTPTKAPPMVRPALDDAEVTANSW